MVSFVLATLFRSGKSPLDVKCVLSGVWMWAGASHPQVWTSVYPPVVVTSVLWKLWQIILNLFEFPAEVDNQLQQQQTDRHEQHQAKDPERKKAACLTVGLCDGVTQEQSQISPGSTQSLHASLFSGSPKCRFEGPWVEWTCRWLPDVSSDYCIEVLPDVK